MFYLLAYHCLARGGPIPLPETHLGLMVQYLILSS
jgi:hypothetical protein